jgi:hypothetical protein
LIDNTDGGTAAYWQVVEDNEVGSQYFFSRSNSAYDELRKERVIRGPRDKTFVCESQTETVRTVDRTAYECLGQPQPPGMQYPAMAWHPELKRVVLLGRPIQQVGLVENTVWTWNDDCWTHHPATKMTGIEIDTNLRGAPLIYHPELESLLVTGGTLEDCSNDQVSRLTFDNRTHPSYSVSLSVRDARFDAFHPDEIESVQAKFVSGATGGVDLKVWTESGWKRIRPNDAPFNSPAELSYETPDGGVLDLLIMDDSILRSARAVGPLHP